ncbi:MAG: DUF192 domain-containing protein [Phycisphaeraceae bacterium]|nr:DUF192 domain-containing protein [Phycisphaeraceae bacterium]MBX3405712.1 DUF192 domain-containing protein [Phycisphaeraceae bacterium]
MAPIAITLKVALALCLVCACAALTACDEKDTVSADVAQVKLAGKTFHLQIAADFDTRMRGLGGRTHIDDDGGMIFVFPASQVAVQNFVMRDCPIDIDIIYTDGVGRILTMHEMKAEPPRGEGEGKDGEANERYEARLPKYSSRYPATFVIELRAGTMKKLGLKEGDMAVFDHAALKKMAR